MEIVHESQQPLPVARTKNLIVKELPDETLIYDLDSDKAHCLNQTAALVWKNCDGKCDVHQLRKLIEKESSFAVPEEVVWMALNQLTRFQLLEKVPERPSPLTGMHRRELVRRFGVTLSLPLIISIVAPTALAQGSPGCKNQICASDADCCPQNPDCGNSGKCK